MTSSSGVPEDLVDAVKFIQGCKGKKFLTSEEKIDLNRAKLRVAYWACRSENIVATRENLAYILGPADAADIMQAYDKYLVTEDEAKRKKKQTKRKDKGTFWEGA